MKGMFWIFALLILLPSIALSASFDCSRAQTQVEQTICSDSDLSQADEELSTVYKRALEKSNNKKQLKREQQEWIEHRNGIYTPGELLHIYTLRINELGGNVKVYSLDADSQQKTIKDQGLSGEQKFVIFVLLMVLVLTMYAVGIKLQNDGNINIFVDYTDALLTLVGFLIPLIFMVALAQSSEITTKIMCVLLTIAALFLPVKSSFIYNKSKGMAALSLMIKFFTSFMYVLGIFVIMGGGRGSQKDDESDTAYELRLQRERASQAVLMAIHHVILVFIVHKTARIHKFTSETLHMSFDNRFDKFMAQLETQDSE